MSERYLSNPDDVAANRSGTLTDRQRRQAMQLNWGAGCLAIVLVVVIGGLLTFPFVLMWLDEDEVLALIIPALIVVGAGVPILVLSLIQVVRLVLTRQDLEAGEVQQADGVVAWRRYRYAAEFPGRAFWANNTMLSLPPGPYRFYYLPRSGYVLSAQAMPGMMTISETAGIDQVLGQVIGFSAGDVERNRAGQLGGGQAARMVAAMAGLGLLALVILLFAGFMAWGILSDLGDGGAAAIPLVLAGAIGLIGPLAIAWSILKLVRDLLGGQVVYVDGPVQRTAVRSGKNTIYYYQVGGLKFNVSLRAYQAMIGGQVFRVYYTPLTKRLVGLESKGR